MPGSPFARPVIPSKSKALFLCDKMSQATRESSDWCLVGLVVTFCFCFEMLSFSLLASNSFNSDHFFGVGHGPLGYLCGWLRLSTSCMSQGVFIFSFGFKIKSASWYPLNLESHGSLSPNGHRGRISTWWSTPGCSAHSARSTSSPPSSLLGKTETSTIFRRWLLLFCLPSCDCKRNGNMFRLSLNEKSSYKPNRRRSMPAQAW